MIRCFMRGQTLALLVSVAAGACGGGGGGDNTGGAAGAGRGGSAPPPVAGSGGASGAGGGGVAGRGGMGMAGRGMAGAGGNRRMPDAAVQSNPEFNTACMAYAGAFCGKLMECEPATITADFNDMGTCVSRKAAQCQLAVIAPGTMLMPAMVMACASQMTPSSCELFTYKGIAACNFRGRRGDGTGCADNWQCTSGICSRGKGVNCGACSRELGMNAPCGDNDCGATLECSDNKICQIPSAVGGPCSAAQPCKAGAFCNGAQCAAQVEMANGACQVNAACAGHKGLACVQQRCTPIRFVASGQACGGGGELANSILCQGSSECSIQQGNAGTCSMVAADGAACGGAAGTSCLAPADCISGFCKIPSGAECN